jgi:predicted lipid-binding transport protein (Tim44 family)
VFDIDFDIYTIILLAFAVFIFLRLRSVLGQRTGREKRPYDPFPLLRPLSCFRRLLHSVGGTPAGQRRRGVVPRAADVHRGWSTGIAEPDSAVAAGLDAIAREDKTFDPKHFISGARTAYEMIVPAYAEGDRSTLRNLLSREVYEGFDAVIRERLSKGETVETRFVAIDRSDITAAEVRGRAAQVTVRFVSQVVSVTRDKAENVIEGNPEKITNVTDVWTFARDLSSRDPNWKLVAAEAGR